VQERHASVAEVSSNYSCVGVCVMVCSYSTTACLAFIYLFIYLFFTFHRSKLGYNNHKDTEIVVLLDVSNIK